MRPRLLFSIAALAVSVASSLSLTGAEANFTAQGLDTPVFDASGRLVRRLVAASATGPFSAMKLADGYIDFFTKESAQTPGAKLEFKHALYDRAAERITGEDSLRLTVPARKVTLSGVGYGCVVNTGQLTLTSDVKCVTLQFRLSGDKADIRFDPKAVKQEDIVREAIVTGTVRVEPMPGVKLGFDKAETSMARYDADRHKLHLKMPVAIWAKGERAMAQTADEFLTIDLGTAEAQGSLKK
jgi:hypothetical protein